MRNIKSQDCELINTTKINIILGKNGCGKSSILRILDAQSLIIDDTKYEGNKRYISPERGGVVLYNANIENSIKSNNTWLSTERRKNQSGNFRNQSAALFKDFEVNVLRKIEQDDTLRKDASFTFDRD